MPSNISEKVTTTKEKITKEKPRKVAQLHINCILGPTNVNRSVNNQPLFVSCTNKETSNVNIINQIAYSWKVNDFEFDGIT